MNNRLFPLFQGEMLVVKAGWEGELRIDTDLPNWDMKRDKEHAIRCSRFVELITVTPYDPPIKPEPAADGDSVECTQGDVKTEDTKPVLVKEEESVALQTVLTPFPSIQTTADIKADPMEDDGQDGAGTSKLLHAAVQTDTPQGICLVVGGIVHRATQTEWEGNYLFHKAVQVPEVAYNSEDDSSAEFKKPTQSGSVIKLAGGYGSVTSVPRKQVVLVNKPDGGVTSVSLAPKTYEPDRTVVKPAQEESKTEKNQTIAGSEGTKPQDKSAGDGSKSIFDEGAGSAKRKRPASPLQGAANVYFASGAIKPFSPPVEEDQQGFIGPLYKSDEDKGEESLRFVPRTVGHKKHDDEKPEAKEVTPVIPGRTSIHSSPVMTAPEIHTSAYIPRHASPSRPHGITPQAMVMPATRPQMMIPGAQLSMPGAGLMGSMPSMARPQLAYAGMSGLATGMDQLAAYQGAAGYTTGTAAAAAGYTSGTPAVLPSMYYQQAQTVQQSVYQQQAAQQVLQQQALQQQQAAALQQQQQPMYYYDPTTGQVVFQQM